MKFLRSLLPSALLLGASAVSAASSWNFDEAVISVSAKGAAGFKDKYVVTPARIGSAQRPITRIYFIETNL
jgi:hypothetical protein